MSLPGGWELILIVTVGVLLFGAKRLPDAARSAGRSLRIFKAETKGLREDSERSADARELDAVRQPGDAPPPATPSRDDR